LSLIGAAMCSTGCRIASWPHFPSSSISALSLDLSLCRQRLRIDRVRYSTITLCRSGDFADTKRMVGRGTAWQVASASAMSFFWRFT
jgi:hypothetical protein